MPPKGTYPRGHHKDVANVSAAPTVTGLVRNTQVSISVRTALAAWDKVVKRGIAHRNGKPTYRALATLTAPDQETLLRFAAA